MIRRVQASPRRKTPDTDFPQLKLPLPGFPEAEVKIEETRCASISEAEDALADPAGLLDSLTGLEQKSLARQAQKMEAIGTLASGIAHDFNNILTPILLRAEMGMNLIQEDSPLRHQLEQIMECGQRARDLVQQILNFSHHHECERKPLQLSLVVKEIVKLLRSSLPSTVEIRQDIRGSGMVIADLTLIHMLLMELCVKTAKTIFERGGLLVVSLNDIELDRDFTEPQISVPKGSYVRLIVKHEAHPESAASESLDQDGPELRMVRSIVEQHGGTMLVYKEKGINASFHVFIPRMECPDRGRALSGASPIPKGTERILLVDDEKAIADTLKQMLTVLGYTVVSTTSSHEALEIFKRMPENFDLVITDQTMPGMTGMLLATEIHRIRSEIPILLCSGFGDVAPEKDMKKNGVREVMMKPLSAHEIGRKIRELFETRPN